MFGTNPQGIGLLQALAQSKGGGLMANASYPQPYQQQGFSSSFATPSFNPQAQQPKPEQPSGLLPSLGFEAERTAQPSALMSMFDPEAVKSQQVTDTLLGVGAALMEAGAPSTDPGAASRGWGNVARAISGANQTAQNRMLQGHQLQAQHSQRMRKLALEWQKLNQSQLTNNLKEYNFAVNNGYKGTFSDWMTSVKKAGAPTVTVNQGGGIPKLGKLPDGHTYLVDSEGNIKTDEAGVPIAAPIRGTPQFAKVEAQKQAGVHKKRIAQQSADIVVSDIDRALKIINQKDFLDGTGLTGHLLKDVPGSDAHSLSKLLDTVKANAAFDKLQRMRDASPTGGALGAVSERELALLQAAIGSLDQSQDHEQLEKNLERVKSIYQQIIHGTGAGAQTSTNAQQGGSIHSDNSYIPELDDPEQYDGLFTR